MPIFVYNNFAVDMGMTDRSPLPTMPPRNSSNDTGYPELCYDFLDIFKFPVFEVLVTFQIVLPVFYSFFVPCVSVFILECSCQHQSDVSLTNFRRKLSTVLIGSWVHWYLHWEMWTWFWCILAGYFSFWCAMPPRYYEYCVGLGTTSIMVCLISNLLSDYRLNLPEGKAKSIFNLGCFCFSTWLLRILYPCVFNIGVHDADFDFFGEFSEDISPPPTPPPPSYNEAIESQPPPPSYAETLSRIRAQLPKLQRSISLQAQKLGRDFSVRRKTRTQQHQSSANVRSRQGYEGCKKPTSQSVHVTSVV
ncbi:uncharacterized protein LOC131890200 [Tigriopus californicus]|uniref:uncharacterized protein LOC131890200 n=1 Tax=Tigriopus californicus TaxID=6832 RepID=UPI0027DA1F89|nr:uncharacterized protein LOC131890200 [Tigriopus californicus]